MSKKNYSQFVTILTSIYVAKRPPRSIQNLLHKSYTYPRPLPPINFVKNCGFGRGRTNTVEPNHNAAVRLTQIFSTQLQNQRSFKSQMFKARNPTGIKSGGFGLTIGFSLKVLTFNIGSSPIHTCWSILIPTDKDLQLNNMHIHNRATLMYTC